MFQSLGAFLQGLDTRLLHFVNSDLRKPWLDVLVPVFSLTWLLWALSIVVFAAWGFRAWRHADRQRQLRHVIAGALLTLVTVGVMNLIVVEVKSGTGRLRPHQSMAGVYHYSDGEWALTADDFAPHTRRMDSFFSGHAAHSMAVAVIAAGLFPPLSPYVYAIPVLTGLSRLYLGKHYPSDVLCGWIAGWLVASFALRVTRRFRKRMDPSFDRVIRRRRTISF